MAQKTKEIKIKLFGADAETVQSTTEILSEMFVCFPSGKLQEDKQNNGQYCQFIIAVVPVKEAEAPAPESQPENNLAIVC
jgi:hypothetical protein